MSMMNVITLRTTLFDGCDKLTICGMKGSYAEQYAKKHNIPFEKLDTTIQSVN